MSLVQCSKSQQWALVQSEDEVRVEIKVEVEVLAVLISDEREHVNSVSEDRYIDDRR